MSLLLDALNKASAQKEKNNDASSKSPSAGQDLDSSQKQAASLFSSGHSPSRSKVPVLIGISIVMIISAGIYWWPFPNDLDLDRPSALKSDSDDIPDIVSTAEQLEEMSASVDQMQEEHAITLIEAERTRNRLEIAVSDKTKTLKNTNKLLVAAKASNKELNTTNLNLKSALRDSQLKLKSSQQKSNEEILGLKQSLKKSSERLAVNTKALSDTKGEIAQLNMLIENDALKVNQLTEVITENQASLNFLNAQHNKEIVETTDRNKELERLYDSKTEELKLAEQKVISLNEDLTLQTKEILEAKDEITKQNNTLRKNKDESEQLSLLITESQSSLKTLKDQNSDQIIIANKNRENLSASIQAKTVDLNLAEQKVIALNAQIDDKDLRLRKIEDQLSDVLAVHKMTDTKNTEVLRLAIEKQDALSSTIKGKNQQQAQALIQLKKFEQENKLLGSQLDSLKKENEIIKKQQLMAKFNISKIQQVQDNIFLQLKNEYQIALSKIEQYELEKQGSKQTLLNPTKINPEDSITLKLDTHIGTINH
jgi:hypothetical protein